MGGWLAAQGTDALQNAAIVAGFLISFAGFLLSFAGYRLNVAELREDRNARRVSNLITLTQQHREIWRDYLRPELARLRDSRADLTAIPVSREEETFVKFVINHLASCFQAKRLNEVAAFGDMSADARAFFSLPIPGVVWDKVKFAHDPAYVDFVEEARRRSES